MFSERIQKLIDEQGWTPETVLGLLVEYINNQDSEEVLFDFLQDAASTDEEV